MSSEERAFFMSVMEYQSSFCTNFLRGEKGSFVCITIFFQNALTKSVQLKLLMTLHCIEIRVKGKRQRNGSWTLLKLVTGEQNQSVSKMRPL
jgi:hypothetical protein